MYECNPKTTEPEAKIYQNSQMLFRMDKNVCDFIAQLSALIH